MQIQLSLDTSLNDLNRVLNDVNVKIVTVHSSNPDSTSTSFDRCCDLQDSALTYLPEFQSKVSVFFFICFLMFRAEKFNQI